MTNTLRALLVIAATLGVIACAQYLAGCAPAHAAGICAPPVSGMMTALGSSDPKTGCEINGGTWDEFSNPLTTTEINPRLYQTLEMRPELLPGWTWQQKETKWTDRVESVPNAGNPACAHDWATQSLRGESFTSCLVIHGPCGCPNDWPYFGRICRKCLRKEIVRSVCETVEPKKTEYEVLDERIKK